MGGLVSKEPAPTATIVPLSSVVKPEKSGGWMTTVLGALAIAVIGLLFWNWLQKKNGLPTFDFGFDLGTTSSGDKAPTPIDGKTRTVIPAAEVPPGPGGDFGIQYWMYIANWDYKFGQDKEILKRISPSSGSVVSPRIYLGATDNTLHVQTSIYPSSTAAGAATASSTSSTGDAFTCSVENVPLQSWFSVSVTVFQRNMDIYINGRLVKSCVLPGIPKPALGDIIINDNGGFAGSICNVNSYGSMLTPEDARKFFAAGTTCAAPGETTSGAKPVDRDSVFITLFGYTFRFSKLDKSGKELSSYTL